jgi:hypothetical protein
VDAQQFIGDADYPNIIDKADDGRATAGLPRLVCENCVAMGSRLGANCLRSGRS